jgi:hypothetical protein
MDDKPQGNGPEQLPPQRLTPPDRRNSREEQDITDIERQEKINRLRTNEDFEVPYDPPKKKRKFWRKLLRFFGWMLLIVLLTGGGAGAAWYFWLKDEPQPKTSTREEAKMPPPTPAAEEPEPTETYTSSAFLLQFDYPEGWKVSEGVDNKIVGVSPVDELKTVSGSKQKGQIVLTIQRKQASLPDFKDGSALAIRESEKIDYAKPSQTQRASTYISFLNYNASIAKGLDGVYVTGDNGYKKDQYVPMADIAKSDPLITITFRSCDDDKCTTPGKAVTVSDSSWSDTKFAKPLRTMLQSIIVQ